MAGGLPTFMEDYNARFARPPRSSHDAHRAPAQVQLFAVPPVQPMTALRVD
jgi:hypothetical protein